MQGEFEINNKTKGKLPSLPFVDLRNDILGKGYSLSVAFVSPKESQKINKTYREKNKPTNVLSFQLSKKEGELVLCPAVIKKEVKKFGRNYKELCGFLVIHGMLHLKGMQHSSRMEREEEKYDQKYFNRNRHRVFHNEDHSKRTNKRRKKS